MAAIFISDEIAGSTLGPAVDGAALTHRLLFGGADDRIGIVHAVADDGAGNRAHGSGDGAAIATADLIAEQATGNAANDTAGIAIAALLRTLGLDVFGMAFLARLVDLLDLWRDADHASEIFEFSGLYE